MRSTEIDNTQTSEIYIYICLLNKHYKTHITHKIIYSMYMYYTLILYKGQ